MENKVIYVPVSVQEELPEERIMQIVLDAKGDKWHGFLCGSEWVIITPSGVSEAKSKGGIITHWLKRIELPSEEEIIKAEGEFYKNGIKIKPQVYTFRSGINYILSIINQKK